MQPLLGPSRLGPEAVRAPPPRPPRALRAGHSPGPEPALRHRPGSSLRPHGPAMPPALQLGPLSPCGPRQLQLLQGPSSGAARPALSFPLPRSRELRGLGWECRGGGLESSSLPGSGPPLPGSNSAVMHNTPPREHGWLPAASPGFWKEGTRHVESDVFRYPWKQNKI